MINRVESGAKIEHDQQGDFLSVHFHENIVSDSNKSRFRAMIFYDMQTETQDIVNESSYGCAFAQTPSFQSALKHTAGY